MEATIYYLDSNNTTRDERFEAGKGNFPNRKSAYKEICTITVESEDPLEYLFRKFNIGDRNRLPIRAMMAGDIVVLDGITYGCTSVGWEEIWG